MTAPVTRTIDQLTGERSILVACREIDEVRDENARLRRDYEMLRRQLDGLLDTPTTELHTRIQELEAEVRELKRRGRGW